MSKKIKRCAFLGGDKEAEGSCGGDKEGAAKEDAEGKCGEGKCGGDKES